MAKVYRWLGPGSLLIRHAEPGSKSAALGDCRTSVVRPYDPDSPHRSDNGLITKEENIRHLGPERIAQLVLEGKLEEIEIYDGPERRLSSVDRRQVDRRQS